MRLLNFARNFPENIKMHICVAGNHMGLLEDFRKYNVPIYVVPIARPYIELSRVLRIYRYIVANSIEVVNVFDLKGVVIFAFIRMFSKMSVKGVYHNVASLDLNTKKQNILLRMLLKFFDASVCNSIASRRELEKYMPDGKSTVIYNGVDIDFFRRSETRRNELRRRLLFADNEAVLGIIANFRAQKNHGFLLNAFAILTRKYDHLKLLCVGGGILLEEMEKKAQELKLGNKVTFTGYSDDVIGYLNAIDVVVLTSTNEGLPNVLLEAMSMEIPVISSSVGGCPEIIDDSENGMLFASNNMEEFIRAVELFVRDRSLVDDMKAKARETVCNKFSLATMIEGYERFYKQICHKTPLQ